MRARNIRGWVVGVSLVLGLIGGWALRDAAAQYLGTLRAYTRVGADYAPGSFAWTAPGFGAAEATLMVTNASSRDATLESIDLNLRFNGDFAGSNYAAFAPLVVPAGASRTVVVPFIVTAGERGTAEVTLDGTLIFRFQAIERSRAVRFSARIADAP